MRIANPIYDTVFKYLLEDKPSAQLLLSTLLGEEIIALSVWPQERTTVLAGHGLTVFRLDFAATVKNAAGAQRQVLIEIQKAKLGLDIMRFRRYLGEQYKDPNHLITETDAKGKAVKRALPMVSIYFLGYPLEHSTAPVIRVKRCCTDATTDEPLAQNEPFIESLTHDSFVIQIPYLRAERRTEMEKLLQVFDQSQSSADHHYLDIEEASIAERYRPLVRRLQRAVTEPEVADSMDMEDEILTELQDLERQVEQQRAEKEQAQAEKEQAFAMAEQARVEKEQALGAAEQARAEQEQAFAMAEQARVEKEQALGAAEQARVEQERLLALLKQAGIDP